MHDLFPCGAGFHGFMVQVNGTFYQRGVDLSAATLEQYMSHWPEARNVDFMSYNLPYRLKPSPERVMVVGAGTGHDVAAVFGCKERLSVQLFAQLDYPQARPTARFHGGVRTVGLTRRVAFSQHDK